MRYVDLPVGAVVYDEEDVVELVVAKNMIKNAITFFNLGTGRAYTIRFFDEESLPDDEVLLP